RVAAGLFRVRVDDRGAFGEAAQRVGSDLVRPPRRGGGALGAGDAVEPGLEDPRRAAAHPPCGSVPAMRAPSTERSVPGAAFLLAFGLSLAATLAYPAVRAPAPAPVTLRRT